MEFSEDHCHLVLFVLVVIVQLIDVLFVINIVMVNVNDYITRVLISSSSLSRSSTSTSISTDEGTRAGNLERLTKLQGIV